MTPAARARLRRLVPWAAAALVFALVLGVYGIRYDTNDDATIANIASGAYGPDRAHLVHVSVLLGALLRLLYALAPGANWYVLASLAAMYVGTAVLCGLAMRRFGALPGLALFAALALAFAPEMLYRFQYVRVTALCVVPGLALLAARLGQPLKKCAPGLALAVLGSMIRWEMFCAAGGLSAALLLGRFFALDKAGKRRAVSAMAALFALVLTAKGVDIAAYRLDGGWRAYRAYNAARTEFSDYKVQLLPYGVNAFAAQGVSDAENALLLSWDFYDGEVFPTQRIAALNTAVPARPVLDAVRDAAHMARTLLAGSGAHWALTLTLLAGALLLRWRRGCLPFWGTAALLGAEILFLMWRARWARYVEMSLLLAAVVFLLAALPRGGLRWPRGHRAVLLAGAAAVALLTLPELPALREESVYYRETRLPAAAACDAVAADKEHLYLADVEHNDALAGYDVWHPRPAGYFSNIVVLGGWFSHAPQVEAQLAAAGLASPLADAVDNDGVYILSGHIEMLASYAAERLGRPVAAVAVDGLPDTYRLCSEP